MSEWLYTATCTVCGRRYQTLADSQEEAWQNAQKEKGWQVYKLTGTEHVEVRCSKHWVSAWHD